MELGRIQLKKDKCRGLKRREWHNYNVSEDLRGIEERGKEWELEKEQEKQDYEE